MKLSKSQIEKLLAGEELAYRDSDEGELSRWLMITPFKIHPGTGMPTLNAPSVNWKYRVRHFGIPSDFDYDLFDLHPEYVIDFMNEVVDSHKQVEQLISSVVSDASLLAEPRECSCPL